MAGRKPGNPFLKQCMNRSQKSENTFGRIAKIYDFRSADHPKSFSRNGHNQA